MSTRKRDTVSGTSAKEDETSGGKKICFTVMPFGGWMHDYYEKIFRPAIESAGLEPHRADDLYRPSNVVHDIWEYTKRAAIILADLTGKNPNVLYELGLAHAIAKPAILVTETLDDVPFDLRALRIIQYDKNAPDWAEILRHNIKKAIEEIIAAPKKSVLPTFLEVEETPHRESISPREMEMLEMQRKLDLLTQDLLSSRTKAIDVIPSSRRGGRRVPSMAPSEAEKFVKQRVDEGTPELVIMGTLTEQGFPESWVRGLIERDRKR